MKEGPNISIVAALIGNPACANMLMALLSGPALTATELAQEAGLSLSTVSGHLDKLQKACLVAVERQGRHRYFRLADPDVAAALEGLMPVATGPAICVSAPARAIRSCGGPAPATITGGRLGREDVRPFHRAATAGAAR